MHDLEKLAHLNGPVEPVFDALDRVRWAERGEQLTRHRPAGDPVRDGSVQELRYAQACHSEFTA